MNGLRLISLSTSGTHRRRAPRFVICPCADGRSAFLIYRAGFLLAGCVLTIASCASDGASTAAEAPTNSSTESSQAPSPTPSPAPTFDALDAELMCLSYSALEEMTSVGSLSGSKLMSIPEFATQVRLLGTQAKEIPL